MAMKKAEMEGHAHEYHQLMKHVATMELQGDFKEVLRLALRACDCLDGMMRYRERYEGTTFKSVAAIDVILMYAPIRFDYASLEMLEKVLKEKKQIEKKSSDDLSGRLKAALSYLWHLHRLWDYLEWNSNTLECELPGLIGGDIGFWRAAIERWENMGLMRRVPNGNSFLLTLVTRMGELVEAKCPSCGEVIEAPKSMVLDPLACPKCKVSIEFVLLSTASMHAG